MQLGKGITSKVLKIWALLAVATAVGGILVFTHFETMRSSLREEIRQRLVTIAVAATFLITPEENEEIFKKKDPNDPLYRNAVSKLRSLAERTLPEVQLKGLRLARESIYTLIPSEGTVWRFVLDTMFPCDRDGDGKISEDEMPARIGEEYDVSRFQEMLRCFHEGRPTADTDLTVDKWGVWLSGYAPLKDKNNRVVAIVGVDMNVETLAVKERELVQLAFATFASIILTVFLLALLLYRWQSTYEQLSRTEELQRKLVELSADLIFSLNADGTIKSVNAKICDYGYSPSNLVGQPLTDFVVFEERWEGCEKLKKLCEGETVQPCQVSVRMANGQMKHGEWRCFGIYENGRLVEIWGVFRDLSPLLILTRELKSKASELSKLSHEQSLLLKDIRRQAEQLSVLDELVLAAIQQREIASVAQAVIDGLKPLFPETGLAVFKYDHSTATLKLVSGNEKALTVLKHISSDPSQPISADNFQTLPLIQQGKTVKLDDLSGLNSEVAKALVAEGYQSAISCPLYVGNDFLGFFVAFRDRTSSFSEDECAFLQRVANHLAIALYNAQLFEELQRACDELQQAQAMLVQQERLKALGQMASGISHDIGNALVPLIAYAELLGEHPDAKVRDWGRQIATAAEDIMHIVQRLRAFYRSRDPDEVLEAVNLNEIVRQVVDLTKPRWYDMPQREGITIDMVLDLDDSLPSIAGIGSELREALTNLIFNAVDAIVEKGEHEGKITIRTGTERSFAFLEVIDTGIGMDEETKHRCLEPFFTTKGDKGSGLGLMMVYGTIQRHEGRIEIESELGKGTTFRLLFPMKETEKTKSTGEVGRETVPPLKVLFVDDDQRVRGTLGELLRGWGHTVVVAEDGQSAFDTFLLALHSGQPFDIVITDLGMPRMNGAELIRKIREHDPNVPIIIVTAWGKESFIPEANAILSKPVKSQDLMEALAKVMLQRRQERALKGS
ncbi:MAG: response regulator [Armatimonadetes bacterium]|nr:response regulator [Armatimonadota bacterium]MCX7967580.1 response regulator [Armatimonadota bacterium]MDW8143076.1 response regulator [Armatimonadota bacterium]